MIGDGDIITRNARQFRVNIYHDRDHDHPWDNEDGHGPVSDWERRAKRPGELILCGDGRGRLGTDDMHRFYDFQAAVRQAREEGWGFLPYPVQTTQDATTKVWSASVHGAKFSHTCHDLDINKAIGGLYTVWQSRFPSRRAYHAAAARHDFEQLRRYCEGDWHYVGVEVTQVLTCTACGADEDGVSESLWGIESYSEDAINDTINELVDQLTGE